MLQVADNDRVLSFGSANQFEVLRITHICSVNFCSDAIRLFLYRYYFTINRCQITRFDLELVDISSPVINSSFQLYRITVKTNGTGRCHGISQLIKVNSSINFLFEQFCQEASIACIIEERHVMLSEKQVVTTTKRCCFLVTLILQQLHDFLVAGMLCQIFDGNTHTITMSNAGIHIYIIGYKVLDKRFALLINIVVHFVWSSLFLCPSTQ